jgi:hypothetical protein
LRGVGAELHSGLISHLAEVSEEVADLLFAVIDNRTGRSRIDGIGHILAKLLEVTAELIQQGVGGKGRFG